jgi:hypothetical protein
MPCPIGREPVGRFGCALVVQPTTDSIAVVQTVVHRENEIFENARKYGKTLHKRP